MKKAKKLLSLVCALAIILTAIPTFNNTCVNALTTNGLVEDSGFEAGNLISELNPDKFNESDWVLHSNSAIVNSPENDGTKVVRLDNNRGDHSYSDVSTTIDKSNFVIVAVIGSDSNSSYADGYPGITINDLYSDGTQASSNKFGFTHKNRGETKFPNASKYYYTVGSTFLQPKSVVFEEDGYTKITLTIYRVDGKYYYYANGELIIETSVYGEQTGKVSICAFDSYSFAYVHKISVYSLAGDDTEEPEPPEIPEEPDYSSDAPMEGLFADSGFIVGEKFESIDFSQMPTGTITSSGNWNFGNSKIVKAIEGNSNALQITNYYGSSSAYADIPKENFVAVAVLGTNGNDVNADGVPSLQIVGLDENDEYKTAMRLGFSQKNRTSYPGGGKIQTYDGNYDYSSGIEFDEDGYTFVTLTIYSYNGYFYCYVQGEYLGYFANCTGVSTDKARRVAIEEAWSNVYVHSIDVYDIAAVDFCVDNVAFVMDEKVGLDVSLTADNTGLSDIDIETLEFGAVVTYKDGSTPENSTIETTNANVVKFNVSDKAQVNTLETFIEISKENVDKFVNIRPFVLANGIYYYGEAKIYSAAALATVAYNNGNAATKAVLDEYFEQSALFKGGSTKSITFTAFSDFHYMKNLETGIICRSDVSDLEAILKRGEESGSAFVMHCGDFVKDAKVSSELFDVWLNYEKEDGTTMPVYGIYGNHDIEQGNKMEYVNTTLTNDTNTVWGTESKQMEIDSRIAYYYVDYDGFRFIYLDNNYSFNPTKNIWERNYDGSYSNPSANTNGYSLGPVQSEWLKNVLTDAGENDMTCVISAHKALHPKLVDSGGGDAAETVELFKEINNKYPGTISLVLNGHTHANEIVEADGIVWMDIQNTFANLNTSTFLAPQTGIYSDDMTVKKDIYDNEGNFIEVRDFPLNQLQFNDKTFFAEDPLSAVITIDNNGLVVINGTESNWAYNINPSEEFINSVPATHRNIFVPKISSYTNYLYTESKVEPEYEQGDVNGDNNVDAADLALLKKVIAKLTPIDAAEVKYPNVDGEGEFPDAADLALLKKKIAKLV